MSVPPSRLIGIARTNLLRSCIHSITVQTAIAGTPVTPHPDYEKQTPVTYTTKTLKCRVTDVISGSISRTVKNTQYALHLPPGLLDTTQYILSYPQNSTVRLNENDKAEVNGKWYNVSAVVRDSTGVQETAFLHK